MRTILKIALVIGGLLGIAYVTNYLNNRNLTFPGEPETPVGATKD